MSAPRFGPPASPAVDAPRSGAASTPLVPVVSPADLEMPVPADPPAGRPTGPLTRWLTRLDLMAQCQVSARTVTQWVSEGCPCIRRGTVLRFELEAVRAWLMTPPPVADADAATVTRPTTPVRPDPAPRGRSIRRGRGRAATAQVWAGGVR